MHLGRKADEGVPESCGAPVGLAPQRCAGQHPVEDPSGHVDIGGGRRFGRDGLQLPQPDFGADEQQGTGELAAEGAVHGECFCVERAT